MLNRFTFIILLLSLISILITYLQFGEANRDDVIYLSHSLKINV